MKSVRNLDLHLSASWRPLRRFLLLASILPWVMVTLLNAGVSPTRLRCEYLTDPLAIDTLEPRLNWALESLERGQRQTAYQILVARSPEKLAGDAGDLWNSGKTVSDESVQIAYRGKQLRSRDRAFWKVRVWDQHGQPSAWSPPARWEMGLLKPADWKAKWIAHPAPVPTAVAARNGYHSAFTTNAETAKWVVLDLGSLKQLDAVTLFPARPYDWQPDTPGFLFPLRFTIEAADSADFSRCTTLVDRRSADVPNPGTNALAFSFPAVKARFVRLTATRLRAREGSQFGFALAELQVGWRGKNVAPGAQVSAQDSIESGGWSKAFLTDGDLVSHGAVQVESQPAVQLRKSFQAPGPVRRARAFVSALGVYELRVNGRRVGDHVLAPEWTDYHRRVQYQAYDITALLHAGENIVGAIVGDGWYAGRLGMSDGLIGIRRGVYGARPQFLAQLELELADGRVVTVCSDGSWYSTRNGPIRSSDLLDGEVYDARREMPGWDALGFNAAGWEPALTGEPIQTRLVAQPNEPIRLLRELKPIALTEPKPGVFVFDLGQNLVGRCRLELRAAAGTTVTLRHAEMTNEDGTIYTANLRGAPQVDRYLPRGDAKEVFEPAFTQHGFRYVEVTGLAQKPALDALSGHAFNSSAPEVGQFECSNPMLNQLWTNVLWTQRGNMMSVPTDCPQRDERLGWMGDIQAFCQTAMFNMDMAGFFTKWVQDIRDAQADDGRYADFSPHPYGRNDRFTGVPAWGDAGVFVPWRMYVNYGDRRMLAQHLESAKRWVEYIQRRNPDLIWRQGRHNDYNDWLNGDWIKQTGWPVKGGAVPPEVLATAFFRESTLLVAKMAEVLGRQEDARRYSALSDQIQKAFTAAFVQPDGRIQGDTQAGYALALQFNLLPPGQRERAFGHLLAGIQHYGGHASTGIQTTHRLMLELSDHGASDLAWGMLTDQTFPSWGYMIENGATTIWERWDGYVRGRGFQDPGMNSFNHWALGSVGEWMYRCILGLHPDERHPGYKHFAIAPRPGGGLTWARGGYDSVRGPIRTAWEVKDGQFTLRVVVPANTTASVYLPTRNASEVWEGGRRVAEVRDVEVQPSAAEPGAPGSVGGANNQSPLRSACLPVPRSDEVVLRIGSGAYEFHCPWIGRASVLTSPDLERRRRNRE